MKIGDTIGLPDEPPVGAELDVIDSIGDPYRIIHGDDGWYVKGHRRNSIQWKSAFRAWLSEPGTTAIVVKLL